MADGYPCVCLWSVINFLQTALWVDRESFQKVCYLLCLHYLIRRLLRFFVTTAFLLGILAFICLTSGTALYRFSESHKCHQLHTLELLLFQTVWRFCNKQSISIFTPVSVPVVHSHSYSGTFKVFLWSASIISSPEDKGFCFFWCQLLLIVALGVLETVCEDYST